MNEHISGQTELLFKRVKVTDQLSIVTEDDKLATDDLNSFYDFRDCIGKFNEAMKYVEDPTNLLIILPINTLMSCYTYLTKSDIKNIAKWHDLLFETRTSKDEMISQLLCHECAARCRNIIYMFKARSGRPRRHTPGQFLSLIRGELGVMPVSTIGARSASVQTRKESSNHLVMHDTREHEDAASDISHLQKVDDGLKLDVVREWQSRMDLGRIRMVVCAACGTREHTAKTLMVDGRKIDLTLLRNDDLPAGLHPISYNFAAYDRAILNPKGLSDRHVVGAMILCKPCHSAVMAGTMPKFALCNWLYYGRENLPSTIREAFEESSMFERMLISRARCNSICCKFNLSDDNRTSSTLAGFRKGIRGNIMVAPLDAIRMHRVLPPNVEIRDTMTAVIVGDKMPSKSTISKLGPVLVRKSRVQTLLTFLLSFNAHYRPGDDLKFSQENLDAIHDSVEEPAIPKTVRIGRLQENDGTEDVNADYTPRNEDAFIPTDMLHELLMENVGYTEGDQSAAAYNAMKLLALERCLAGKPFVASGTGNRLLPDFNNPSILTWLFPHLDPWGIGGFDEPRRRIKISMEDQLGHLLKSDDTHFEKDAEFAFVFYNIIRKTDVSRNVRFRVSKKEQLRIVNDLRTVNPAELQKLSVIMEKDRSFKPVDAEQIRILKILKSVVMTTQSLPGSDGYKFNMRKQIRALINARGSPTLFITLNPSDVDNPIVRIFGGEEINTDDLFRGELQDLDAWRRKVYAARNPSACARFFDLMVKTFIDVVLRHGSGRRGLYGFCDAYYGAVEAQGKGTLHLHLLVWLRGHLSPQKLRDELVASDEYRDTFITWLESIIMNEFPTVSHNREDEPDRSKRIRCTELGEPHPGTLIGPSLDTLTMDDFWIQYKEHIIRLLNEYNWHEHTATCFKYLQKGEEGTDANCQMRMDGHIVPETTVDEETGHINIRRLHPWISSYTDVVTFLMKCNMNVQFIGSGAQAKAFIYYVTDYVTKASLPVHAGLAALSYAAKKVEEASKDVDDASSSAFCSSSLTKFVNAMMGRQEISHQQVMSYLVGGGDHYTSETFSHLFLMAFLRYISDQEAHNRPELSLCGVEPEDTAEEDEPAYLTIERDDVYVNNQVWDYCYRSTAEPYNSMSLYDFVAQSTKRKVKNREVLLDSPEAFSSWEHPQRGTHRLATRREPVIPVVLGPSLPNRNASEEAECIWAKHILVLFKPWRTIFDLKHPTQTWTEGYHAYHQEGIPGHSQRIIENMQLLSECAEARFSGAVHGATVSNADANDDGDRHDVGAEPRRDGDSDDLKMVDELQRWREQYCSDVFKGFEEDSHCRTDSRSAGANDSSAWLQRHIGKQACTALQVCLQGYQATAATNIRAQDAEKYSLEIHKDELNRQSIIMTKKRKRCIEIDEEDGREQKRFAGGADSPFVSIDTLRQEHASSKDNHQRVVDQIISEMNLETNKEQLTAFTTISNHVIRNDPEHLLLLVSGVGGTGKSHVIKSVVKLFERLNIRKSLLLGAPTGSAAILIGGSTLHSLILENASERGKKNLSKLTAIWKGVRYLIIDEVSMLGARFLQKLSDTMRQAKGDDLINRHKIFGGVNVIFMGDLCQLKPPRQLALYGRPSKLKTSRKVVGQDDIKAMNGIVIWKQVNKVIELVKNCRHLGDPKFSEFLSRLRTGNCFKTYKSPTDPDDYNYLQPRLLSNIYRHNPAELSHFRDAPFIVGSKALRDLLNEEVISFQAKRLNKEVHVYHSRDYCRRQLVTGGSAEYLWSLGSSHVQDSLGRLPIFEGMKVMVTENIAFDHKIVNGTEGVVRRIIYDEDEFGRRYATVVYIYVEGIDFSIPGLEQNVVPIFPARMSITNSSLDVIGLEGASFTRLQLPLIPAYAYTDFKSQGRTLVRAIVDLVTARGQGVYVMLSRVTSLSGIAILRWFPPSKVYSRLPEDLRAELARLNLSSGPA